MIENSKTPPAIRADRLSEAMAEGRISQSALARAIGVSPAAVQQILNGTTKTSKHLRNMAKMLDVSEEWLLGESDNKSQKHTKEYDNATFIHLSDLRDASADAWDYNEVYIIDERMFPFPIFPKGKESPYFMLKNLGGDMTPTVSHNDVLMLEWISDEKPSDDSLPRGTIDRQDAIWCIRYHGIPMLRRVRIVGPGRAELSADNPSIRSQVVDIAEISPIGRAVWLGKAIT